MDHSYFLGSNTTDGFVGRFDKLLQTSTAVILKGGAGCGKSTLMKKVAAEAKQRGLDVEYFYCSGDVNSLDGVSIPALNIAVLDGTEPHSLEPVLPLIKHRVVNLLDKAKLDKNLIDTFDIEYKILSKKAHFSNAFCYLKALKCVINKIASEQKSILTSDVIETVLRPIFDKFNSIQDGITRELFMSAITAEGIVSFASNNLVDKYNIVVNCNHYTFVHTLLPRIENELKLRQISYTRYLSPFYPSLSEAIEIGNIVVSNYLEVDASLRVTFPSAEISNTDTTLISSLLCAAEKELSLAKNVHLQIEEAYIGANDWDDVNLKTANIIDEIFKNC
jgi:NACHT domain.